MNTRFLSLFSSHHLSPTLPSIHSSEIVRFHMGSQQSLTYIFDARPNPSPISRLSKVCFQRECVLKRITIVTEDLS